MKITISCFGIYRNFGDTIDLHLEQGDLIGDARIALLSELQKIDSSFNDEALLKRTHFATQTAILTDSDKLENGMMLAVIPPVSGG